ncbi:hypothetical protein D2V93_17025 [Flagellimonas taeanensis]|nr:hypothetical protein D2V93_17025 [Allomuricauda taeanensis]
MIMMRQFASILLLLCFNHLFSQNDSIKSLVTATNKKNFDIEELVDFARDNLDSEPSLARFFYLWIGNNIIYDYQLLEELEEGAISNEDFWASQNVYSVYENRKGVCAGYAQLFEWFMNKFNIETAVISGHIRDERNHYVEIESDDKFRHAWNAVKLDQKWILLDATWGTSGDSSVSDFYFNIKPELAIITHFPENDKWQLLERPLSLQDFNNSKFIKPIWFQIGFKNIPELKQDDEYYYLVYESNPNNNWSVTLMIGDDNATYEWISDVTSINQDGFTYLRFKKSGIPEKAYYKLDLKYNDEENGTSTFIFNVFYFKT